MTFALSGRVMTIEIRAAPAADRDRVLSFLREQGYPHRIDESDRHFIAEREEQIVAAVRLSSVEPALVLRGMRVTQEFQRQGIGRRLLAFVTREVGRELCYCLPYSWLVSFYGEAGFREIPAVQAPSFLAARQAKYVANGQDVTIMRRP
jgi:predicted N-acetyltransferase YhbS